MNRWGGRRAMYLSRLVLARDYSPALGYTPCHHCGRPAATADHWPVSRMNGGPDSLDNLVAACGPCNYSRGAKEGNRARAEALPPSRDW